jgi:hypothetical protein
VPVPAAELAVQTRLTQTFINSRPVTITLTPHTWSKDGSGGRKKTPGPPRTPQVVRFIEQVTVRNLSARTDIGSQYAEEATVLMMPDAEVAPNDEFEWDGSTWRVDSLQFPNEWSKRAAVLRYGR